jgi:glycerol-3-phosphate O-acyltransferase
MFRGLEAGREPDSQNRLFRTEQQLTGMTDAKRMQILGDSSPRMPPKQTR